MVMNSVFLFENETATAYGQLHNAVSYPIHTIHGDEMKHTQAVSHYYS